MANRSGSTMRGVRYAIAIGLVLTILFCAGEYTSDWKRPGYYRAPRTTTLLVRAQPGKVIKIVAEPLPIQSETPIELMDRSMWASYKSEAPNQLSMIEPPAGAKLSAPVSLELSDPFAESAPVIAWSNENSELNNSIDASTVSATKPITVSLSGESRPAAAWERNWPQPIALLNEIDRVQALPLGSSDIELKDWLAGVEQTLSDLQTLAIGNPSSDRLLSSLQSLVTQGHELSSKRAEDIDSARDLSRIVHALDRRRAVWTSVQLCVIKSKEYVAPRKYTIDSVLIADRLDAARRSLASTEDSAGWSS